ncbi:helix-hairpin-helix domain-containing protein [Streptomyces goshikiensis]|uniref:helix-hairpin-helix domain-containing protein n=1 Tax=Streptomyces goshikiensis TaxID=1942 RepID=UPI0036538C1A
MTTRTRTPRPARATSGPGRRPLSDGRLRHRGGARRGVAHRGGARLGGVRRGADPHPDPIAVRRRAEALLGGGGPAPPPAVRPAPPPAEPVGPVAGPAVVGAAAPAVPPAPTVPPPAEPAERPVLAAGVARSLAVRERLPVWLQARCGVEPRTVAAVGVVLVAAVGFAAQQYWSGRPQPVTAPAVVAPVPAPVSASAAPGAGGTRIVVDVSGKVRDPGVRRLPAGSRVEDALAAAGGVRPGTDTGGLNRARVLVDGEQVLVGAPAQPVPGASGPGAGPLSLGSATVDQLDGLPGVGPVLAQHIVDFRTARGGFRSVEDLRQVNGIGERRFADLRKLVRP